MISCTLNTVCFSSIQYEAVTGWSTRSIQAEVSIWAFWTSLTVMLQGNSFKTVPKRKPTWLSHSDPPIYYANSKIQPADSAYSVYHEVSGKRMNFWLLSKVISTKKPPRKP